MLASRTLLERLYRDFNARDIAAVLNRLHDGVKWPNGLQGGFVHGHEALRAYWSRQWLQIDPVVTPIAMTLLPDGRIAVDVHQVVRDLAGAILKDVRQRHLYRLEGGLVREMEIAG